ncbi:hypothetical protein BH10PSE14_BH10PSE14_17840 [soil metagenome]
MMIRVLMGVVPMTVSALVYSGAVPVSSLFGGSSFSADVAASPSTVASALSDLKMEEITKSGTVPYVTSLTHRRTTDGMEWTLLADGKKMLEMVATLSPTNDGTGTHVAAETHKGVDYDEQKLGRGLQDMGLVNTVFGAALTTKLNEFLPPAERKSVAKLEQDRMATVTGAMTAKLMMNPMAIAVEGRRREVEFKDQMASDMAAQAVRERQQQANAGVNFVPGQPMVDVSHH